MVDVFLCDGVRTPIGRYAGALSSVRADDLAATVLSGLIKKNPNIDPLEIDEVIFGCANQAGEDNRNVARMATLLSGLPISVPATTINRLCGSGLDAVITACRAVTTGELKLVIAGGVENMSRAPFVMPKSESAFSRSNKVEDTTIGWRFINKKMFSIYGTDSMPETAENVAEHYNINREDQDLFAFNSQKKYQEAKKNGRFELEIIPVEVPQKRGDPLIFEEDEHPRETDLDKMAKLPTPFKENGTVTAGNASGVNDGAGCLLIASEDMVKKYSLRPLARYCGGATAGVEPKYMGIGPVFSTQKILKSLNIEMEQIGLIELNEAFASQSLACMRGLGVADDSEIVNPNGGAIALGHPLGMSGARLALTSSIEIHSKKIDYGLCTMCVGVGQGISMIIARV